MIPLETAQRDSITVTENSINWFDKRFMRKIEKKIDRSIQMAGDAMQNEVEINIRLDVKDRHYSDKLTSKEIKKINLIEILLTQYKIQGYYVKSNFKHDCRTADTLIFDKYIHYTEITIFLKWDKDYNPLLDTKMVELENKYVAGLPKYKVTNMYDTHRNEFGYVTPNSEPPSTRTTYRY